MIDFEKLKTVKNKNAVVVVGVPSDENSSYLKGTAEAPQKIIEAFHCNSTNLTAENGIDLSKDERIVELRNMSFTENKNVIFQIEEQLNKILEYNFKIISLGGDHAVSYPLIKSTAKKYDKITILHFDAHPDLYDDFEGNKFSHACPFARVMEEKLAVRMVSVGIRCMNAHQKEQAEKFGVEINEMKDWKGSIDLKFNTPVYISLDIDVLDPGFAPGISHYEPGGFSPREVISIIHKINQPIIGADIVELNPSRDINNITAMTAAKFLKEIAGKMISRN